LTNIIVWTKVPETVTRIVYMVDLGQRSVERYGALAVVICALCDMRFQDRACYCFNFLDLSSPVLMWLPTPSPCCRRSSRATSWSFRTMREASA